MGYQLSALPGSTGAYESLSIITKLLRTALNYRGCGSVVVCGICTEVDDTIGS